MRKLAVQRSLDPDKWFNNVEVVTSEKIGDRDDHLRAQHLQVLRRLQAHARARGAAAKAERADAEGRLSDRPHAGVRSRPVERAGAARRATRGPSPPRSPSAPSTSASIASVRGVTTRRSSAAPRAACSGSASRKGERVAIMGDPCEEWMVADLGGAGARRDHLRHLPDRLGERGRVPAARRRAPRSSSPRTRSTWTGSCPSRTVSPRCAGSW